MKPSHRAMAAAATLGAAAAIAFTAETAPHRAAKNPPLATFTDSGVTVTVTTKTNQADSATLEVTFAPSRPGFHLYSADLPPTGVDGIGRPLTLTTDGALRSTAKPTTDVAPHMSAIQGLGTSVPVYPDGPVTAELPVTLEGSGPADVIVGYAACSETECLAPVTAHAIALRVADGTIVSAKTTR